LKSTVEKPRLEQYFTPVDAVLKLRDFLPNPLSSIDLVFEPCVGKRIIPHCLEWPLREDRPRKYLMNDIDASLGALESNFDMTKRLGWSTVATQNKITRNSWCITNPPWSTAPYILHYALKYFKNVALLLRISFLEPCKDRFELPPPSTLVVMNRISFTGDGKTDNVTAAWFIWSKDVKPGIFYASKYK